MHTHSFRLDSEPFILKVVSRRLFRGGCFEVVSRSFRGCLKVASRLFKGCFEVVSMLFKGCFSVKTLKSR